MGFSERLKEWIQNNGIKQTEIAEKAGVTCGYVSSVVNGRKPPSENILNALIEMSGKYSTWWLFGKDDYDNLDSLNALINTFIKTGQIRSDGSMDDEIREILITMLEKEIRVKLENKTHC